MYSQQMFNEYDQSTGIRKKALCCSCWKRAYLPAAYTEQEAHHIALLLFLKLLEVLVGTHLKRQYISMCRQSGAGGWDVGAPIVKTLIRLFTCVLITFIHTLAEFALAIDLLDAIIQSWISSLT